MKPFVATIADGHQFEQELTSYVLIGQMVDLFGFSQPAALTHSARSFEHQFALLLPFIARQIVIVLIKPATGFLGLQAGMLL